MNSRERAEALLGVLDYGWQHLGRESLIRHIHIAIDAAVADALAAERNSRTVPGAPLTEERLRFLQEQLARSEGVLLGHGDCEDLLAHIRYLEHLAGPVLDALASGESTYHLGKAKGYVEGLEMGARYAESEACDGSPAVIAQAIRARICARVGHQISPIRSDLPYCLRCGWQEPLALR